MVNVVSPRPTGAIAGLALALTCACSSQGRDATPVRPTASETEAPAPAPESPAPAPAPAPEAAAATAESPAPEPEPPAPAPLTAPDGTRMAPCETPPPGMACVPGGPFIRGVDDGPENARPQATVWAQTFYMDIDEVTFADYKACEKARACDRAGPQYLDFSRPTQPINGISWFDADKYCRAKGKRLPTEAQWEKASRGPDGEALPWGDAPATCERAIIKGVKEGRGCGLKKAGKKPETGRVWPVGSRPAYRYGLRDMAGNSYEWVADWYSRSYEDCGEACEGVDPRGPCDGAAECPGFRFKVVRGGSWYWDASRTLGYHRRPHVPNNNPFHHFGFRCAATLEDAVRLRGETPATPAPSGTSQADAT